MKIALAQINPTVGDVTGNQRRIADAIADAAKAGADLCVFPELSIIGYPPKDLLLKPAVIDACRRAVAELAGECGDTAAIVGYPAWSENPSGLTLRNAAALIGNHQTLSVHHKSLLPTYDVFDEQRYFEPGPRVDLTDFAGVKLGVSVCEDLWNDREMFSRQLYHDNPIADLAEQGADLFINTAASPFIVRKHGFRRKLMTHAARKYGLPVLYCNQVGGNDELIFDGRSMAVSGDGDVVAEAAAFEQDLLFVEWDPASRALRARSGFTEPGSQTPTSEAYHALVLGLRDYCRKCGFDRVVIGLSGGIDSAVTCAIAVAALGAENVRGVTMPSRFSSAGSKSDAQKLAEALGAAFHTIPIESPHLAFEDALRPLFAQTAPGAGPGVAEENIQARCRGILLMAISNKLGEMVVTTGNKSELAVGYCTLYGDMAGGLAVLSDVPKTMVYDLARWINDDPASPLRARFGGPVIPRDTITKPPSAELRADQLDEDSLPPYDVLDQIIERYVEREQPAAEIIEQTGYDAEVVLKMVRLIDRNEYKRKQAAPGLKITGRAFGFGRRMPIAQRWDSTKAPVPSAEPASAGGASGNTR